MNMAAPGQQLGNVQISVMAKGEVQGNLIAIASVLSETRATLLKQQANLTKWIQMIDSSKLALMNASLVGQGIDRSSFAGDDEATTLRWLLSKIGGISDEIGDLSMGLTTPDWVKGVVAQEGAGTDE